MCDVADLLPAFRYITGEKANICRFCFDAVDPGVSLDESRRVECFYYDDTVAFAEVLIELGAPCDSSLPRLLCESCADLAMKAFFFQKLSQHSYNKWHEAINRLHQTLDAANTIGLGVKTAYFLILKESNRILTGWKDYDERTKEAAAEKITKSVRRRDNYERSRKNKTVICHECGEKIKCRDLSKHIIRKHNKKSYLCPNCDKTFKDPICLRNHEERVHAPKTVRCLKCNKKFGSDKILRQHDLKIHMAATCKRCFKKFPSGTALKSHYETHDLHQCPRCFKKFKSKITLSRHLKRCQDDPETVICDICNNRYSSKRGLKSHLVTMHGFGCIYTCKWCNKGFDAISRLKVHQVKHTRERSFSCEQCGDVFVSKAALTYHTRIHTGEKPFSCDVCGEKFLSASRRMDHKRWKHLEPRHVCSVCGNKFRTKFCLNKHFARHNNPQSKLFTAEF